MPMIPRPDLLTDDARDGLELFQLTDEPLPSCHVYMEAQIFTPDSKRFVLHRGANPHGADRTDPEHRYMLCDLENGGALSPLTDEIGAIAPSLTPDGKTMYYFVDETSSEEGRLTLKRVNLDGTARETLLVIDGPIPGASHQPRHLYSLSTIRSDGKSLASSAFLGDGSTPDAPFGLLVIDLEELTPRIVLSGPTWLNLHAQYSRSLDDPHYRDILVQENHGCHSDAEGKIVKLVGGDGAEIHVVRDDGDDFRSLPWGRDGREFCQGHQCWHGRGITAITAADDKTNGRRDLVESPVCPFAGHIGNQSPGGTRNLLSRDVEAPRFVHFATDIAGESFVTDALTDDIQWLVYTANFDADPEAPLRNWRHIANTGSSKGLHPHPFLSPDGRCAFFNSDETGHAQAYMVTLV